MSVSINKKWYGNQYGGFYLSPAFLDHKSIVYSIGIGEDLSFDMAVIENHTCNVFGFDPTPKSINWVKKNKNIPQEFIFYDYGIANKSGMIDFYLPKNSEHISGSFVKQKNVNDKYRVLVEMKLWEDLIKNLKHEQIDVLKMGIEGAEYSVLDSILENTIPINQILIEFHERFFEDGKIKTIDAIKKLKNHGYEIFGISDSFEEISFIKTSIFTPNK